MGKKFKKSPLSPTSQIRKGVRKYIKSKKNIQRGGDLTSDLSGLSTAGADAGQALGSFAAALAPLTTAPADLPTGGTSGSINTLIRNVTGLIESSVNTVVDTVQFADSLLSLPSDLGRAYNEPIAQSTFTF